MKTISDMRHQIKNAQAAGRDRLVVPFSKMRWEVAQVLQEAGFVEELDKKKKKARKVEHNWIELKLDTNNGRLPITGVRILSKPSRRWYVKSSELRPVVSGFGIAILSTPRGIMTGKEARKQNLGGELIAEVW